ncbi:MAG: hypothetical protein ACLRNL_08170 [Bifidobacterium adolescentis]
MKHEYTADELKSIYDESGEAGLSRDEMRALRKAGLVKQDLPPEPKKPHEDTLADYQAISKPTAEPSKRDLILAHCRNRIDQGQPFDGKETAEALDISQKTAGNIIGQLRKEGLLPAFDQHSPRKTRKNATTGKKKETMTTTSKLTADKITATKLTPSDITPRRNHHRRATSHSRSAHHHRKRLGRHLRRGERLAAHRVPSQRQGGLRFRHETAHRRIDGHQGQLLEGRKMKLNFDSKDGVFTVKAENKEEITQLKMSAMDIANLIVNYFDAEIQEAKVEKK